MGYPVNFTETGDETKTALYKHIQEIAKIYEHLNEINFGASEALTGTASAINAHLLKHDGQLTLFDGQMLSFTNAVADLSSRVNDLSDDVGDLSDKVGDPVMHIKVGSVIL